MSRELLWVALSLGACAIACSSDDSGDSAVPVEDIPPDTRLVDLSGGEQAGLCNWGAEIVRQSPLPAPGTMLTCDGVQITFNGVTQCGFPKSERAGCEASVAEWMTCFPAFINRLAAAPCLVWDLAFPGDLEAFVEETPGCQGLGPCSYTTTP